MLLFFPDASWTLKPDFSTNHLVLVFFGQLIEAAGSPWEAIAPLSGPQNPPELDDLFCSGFEKKPTFKSRNP